MYFSPTLLRFSLTFHLLFRTFDVLLGWILLREYLFLENNIPDLGFLGLSNAIYMKLYEISGLYGLNLVHYTMKIG